ncbi:fumarate hydratase C-terminal domain-containing protein [Pseudomonas sichuanensis]|nr:fumarate hydratase C-terminal domain-containing protein [Pseudomonas sichuanensis]MDH0732497.1 fumarate hydratase C-terminal domain-containing protein [Pseudomonas sichuanensis]MDH1582604.1 fumarate hydratase C-terminal domain-containing protein [Pseudomonas sichuanensis]MDH1592517.1 fumarate hydratase C-terminal domain-containing protein [Pseudomonas sichuanensis]MDH1597731.1 fumarate hydratase C-terminal domain-containing protein [Pseudomonas sichuanensis]
MLTAGRQSTLEQIQRIFDNDAGIGPKTTTGCLKSKAVHAVLLGGCAVLAATQVEEIDRVQWQGLGLPETLWVNRVREFEQLIISIDTKGNNLFEQNKARFNERRGW